MKTRTLEVGAFGVNCSLVETGGRTYVIDPGAEAERILAMLEDVEPAAVLLTHAHFDHIGGIAGLQQRFPGLRVFVSPDDLPAFGHPMNAYPPDYPQAPRPANILDAIDIPGLEVIATPGHTPGGVCYYFAAEKLLFSGDTLFCGSVGRTDLPGGDMAVLMSSLGKLRTLPPETVVIPGHGPKTTIGDELRGNPFLQ